MSILVKDMEMPDGCYYCPFRQGSFGRVPPHRAMCMVTGKVMPVDEKNIQYNQPCPLVPVPPHGRLIDADALLESIKEAKKKQPEISDVYDEDYFTVAEWVAYAPTIIEPEEGEA